MGRNLHGLAQELGGVWSRDVDAKAGRPSRGSHGLPAVHILGRNLAPGTQNNASSPDLSITGSGTAQTMNLVVNRSLQSTAWASPGVAEFDYRSKHMQILTEVNLWVFILLIRLGDVITTPTLSMLSAIINTTLRDDVFMEDATTTGLEAHMASLTGYEAGMFVITGTMANQLALRTSLTQPPHAILTDAQAHIVHWEAGGIASASGALLQAVSPSNATYLTLEDIKAHAETTDDVHKCPTRVISLENTVAGSIFPLSELRRISKWARSQNPPILLHLDGARLWEAIAAGAGNLRDYAELFDSLSLDFSKNLGAPMGAMVLSSARFIKQARRIRKSIGGGMRQAGVLSSACRAAVDETFGPGIWGFEDGGKLRRTHEMAKSLGDLWISLGGKLERIVETNMLWLDLKDLKISKEELNKAGEKRGVKLDGKRICLHHQISEESISRLGLVFKDIQSYKAKL